jgi:hypothetical protein
LTRYRAIPAAVTVADLRQAPGNGETPEPEANAPVAETVERDYSGMLKDELVAEAESRGIDSSGTKAEIIERLEAADD